MNFLAELKRRRVVRVAIVYGAVSFAVLQAADILVPALRLPESTMTLFVLLLALGLPVALVLAWAFQLTPEGVQRTTSPAPGVELEATTSPTTERWISARTAALAALLLGLGVAAGWLAGSSGASATRDTDPITLAVLPFMNEGGPEDEYFADGMSDAVRGKLAALDGMTVIASSSARRYRGSEKSPQEIGRELGARYLLTGTVRWARRGDGASRVQVSPELISAETGTTRWQQPFDAVLSDVFAVQGEIASRVADALSVNLLETQRAQLAARPTQNLEAYDAYLRASALLRQAEDGAPLRRVAANGFRRAVELDPSFALAWAQLAYAHMGAYWFYEDPADARLRLARGAADTALALAPDLADAHVADGFYWYWGFRNYERGRRAFERARSLDRNNVFAALGVAAVARRQGRWADAAAGFRQGTTLDPLSAGVHRDLAVTLLVMRDLAAADSASLRALRLAPDQVGHYVTRVQIGYAAERPHEAERAWRDAAAVLGAETMLTELTNRSWQRWVPIADTVVWRAAERLTLTAQVVDTPAFHNLRGEWLLLRGERARAVVIADSARRMAEPRAAQANNDWWMPGQLALAHALAGNGRDARAWLDTAFAGLARTPDALDGPDLEYHAAKVMMLIGDHDAALRYLSGLFDSPVQVSRAMVRADLRFAALRGDPRFEDLVRPR